MSIKFTKTGEMKLQDIIDLINKVLPEDERVSRCEFFWHKANEQTVFDTLKFEITETGKNENGHYS